MTRQQFRDSLKALGMTRGQFAKHVSLHPASVYHWGGQDHPVPHWAVMLVAAWTENRRLISRVNELVLRCMEEAA